MVRETAHKTAVASSQEPSTKEILTSLDIEGKGTNVFMTVYKFSRPHTIRGTILAFFSGMGRVFLDNPDALANVGLTNVKLWIMAILGLVALLAGNAFIVGINQIYDVRIDKINKPFLPIASGELDIAGAWIIVLGCMVTGLSLTFSLYSPIIFWLYCFGMMLGMMYSVPPFRFKRNPLAAGITIALVRGALLNFGAFYATREALQLPFEWSPAILFLLIFNTIFATVIAVAKDLPDIKGDRKYKIETFATRLGAKKITYGVMCLLMIDYVFAIVTPLLYPDHFNVLPMVGFHLLLAGLLVYRCVTLDANQQSQIVSFYGFIWLLFYSEFFVFLTI